MFRFTANKHKSNQIHKNSYKEIMFELNMYAN